MSRQRLTVVLSQAQGKNPAKRALEESIAAALILEPGLDVSIIPYLYDLGPDHTGRLFLESVQGDMVLLSWLFEMQGDAAGLMPVTEYHQFLAENWEKTQRMIKGKINEG